MLRLHCWYWLGPRWFFCLTLFRILTNALFLGHWPGNPRFCEAAAACLGITHGHNKCIFASTVAYSQWTRSQRNLISEVAELKR